MLEETEQKREPMVGVGWRTVSFAASNPTDDQKDSVFLVLNLSFPNAAIYSYADKDADPENAESTAYLWEVFNFFRESVPLSFFHLIAESLSAFVGTDFLDVEESQTRLIKMIKEPYVMLLQVGDVPERLR